MRVPAAYVKPGDRAGTDASDRDRNLQFANWPLYIDTMRRRSRSGRRWRSSPGGPGISVRYTEEINDNDEFFGKVSPALMTTRRPAATSSSSATGWRPVSYGWAGSRRMDRAKQPNVAK
ncbi:hypothetical protein GCM10018987_58640 [Streptomyces cremeus]